MWHILLPSLLAVVAGTSGAQPALMDLRGATVVVGPEGRSNPERAAAEVLVEEVAARTGAGRFTAWGRCCASCGGDRAGRNCPRASTSPRPR